MSRLSLASRAWNSTKELIDDATAYATKILRDDKSGALARLGSRFAISGSVTASKVGRLMKDNPIATAFVLWELGDAGAEHLAALSEKEPEVARLVELFSREVDSVEDTDNVRDIVRFKDEFRVITNAVRVVGSYERLINLRKALMMDDEVHKLYWQAQDMKGSL